MDFLTGEDISFYVDEHEMITPYDYHTEEGTTDSYLEDVKYPLRYSGRIEERKDPSGDSGRRLIDREVIEILPRQFKVLQTKEEIDLYTIGREQPFHIVGLLYLPHGFARGGLYPYFQGIVDTGWSGGNLHIILHNANHDRKVIIEKDDRICYISFCYVRNTSKIGREYRRNISGPNIHEDEGTYELQQKYEELQQKYDTLHDYFEQYIIEEDIQ